jgi:hypothetical protein
VFPPRLEGWGIHRGEGKLVLTLVATGHSAGVGEEEQCVLAGMVQRKQGKAARGDDPVRLPLHELLQLCDDNGSTGGLPRLLLLLSPSFLTSPETDWGGESAVGYVWPRAPTALLIG